RVPDSRCRTRAREGNALEPRGTFQPALVRAGRINRQRPVPRQYSRPLSRARVERVPIELGTLGAVRGGPSPLSQVLVEADTRGPRRGRRSDRVDWTAAAEREPADH